MGARLRNPYFRGERKRKPVRRNITVMDMERLRRMTIEDSLDREFGKSMRNTVRWTNQ